MPKRYKFLIFMFLLVSSANTYAIQIGDTDFGVAFPLGVFTSTTRGPCGSAGLIFGFYDDGSKYTDMPTATIGPGLLIDGSVGHHDYSYSVGIAAGASPIGLMGGALRATVLIGKKSDDPRWLSENQRAYGIEGSLAFLVGLRVGLFRAEKTGVNKFITSIGLGF